MTDLAALNALSAEELRTAFTGSPEEVVRLLATAAEGGAVEAQLALGQALLDGHGCAADAGAALGWFIRAAQAGHPLAMNMVGRCIEHGRGTPAHPAAAAAWYRAAADRGLDWGMYNLATLLALGQGCEPDRAQALALFRKAAALGHAKSANMVGSFHEDGWAVARDPDAAALWYAQAAEGGDFRGQFNHARMLVSAGDIDAAIAWLRRVPETATPRFLGQARQWLAQQADPRLRSLRLDRAD